MVVPVSMIPEVFVVSLLYTIASLPKLSVKLESVIWPEPLIITPDPSSAPLLVKLEEFITVPSASELIAPPIAALQFEIFKLSKTVLLASTLIAPPLFEALQLLKLLLSTVLEAALGVICKAPPSFFAVQLLKLELVTIPLLDSKYTAPPVVADELVTLQKARAISGANLEPLP